jgi:hypothetical protein
MKGLTCEHPLQFISVLESACLLEFGYHARLSFVGCGYVVNETFRELSSIERLEHVFVFNIFEQHHLQIAVIYEQILERTTDHLIKSFLQVLFLGDFVVLAEQRIGVFGD